MRRTHKTLLIKKRLRAKAQKDLDKKNFEDSVTYKRYCYTYTKEGLKYKTREIKRLKEDLESSVRRKIMRNEGIRLVKYWGCGPYCFFCNPGDYAWEKKEKAIWKDDREDFYEILASEDFPD